MAGRGGQPKPPAQRGRRALRRLLALGSLTSLTAFVALPPVAAQDDAAAVLPDAFAGAASASALDLALITPDLLPVPGLFDLAIVEGQGTYERSNQSGRASLLYPGNGVVSGPSLLCGTFLGPAIPPEGAPLFGPILDACGQYAYPLAVFVDEQQREAGTEGQLALGGVGDPISLRAVGASARAAADGTTTRAQASDLRLLGVPALGSLAPLLRLLGLDPLDGSLLAVEGMTARTDQAVVDGRLSVEAKATVSGLRLLGGLVRFGSITSRSSLLTAASGGQPEVESELEVTGVTVAGLPAQLTDAGLVVADPNGSTGPIVQQLTRAAAAALQDLGVVVTSLEVEQGEEDGIPFARAQGLLVELTTPLAGLPPLPGPLGDIDVNGEYGLRLQVGSTGVRGFADAFDDGGGDGGSDTGATTGAFGEPPFGSGSFPDLGPSGGPGSPDGATVTGGPRGPATGGLISDDWGDRVGLLYLAFTLGALALCLTPRLTLPARLPGAAPS